MNGRALFRLLFGAGSALFLAACGGGSGSVTGGEPIALQADKVVFGMRHYITANGVRQALLKADTAYHYTEAEPIEFRRVELTIYGATGEVAATLTANTAFLNPRTEIMQALGDVVVVAPEDDQRIETEELHYDPSLDKLWSDHHTTLHRGGKITRGDGFTSDGRGQNFKVIRPSGHVQMPEGEIR
jgi:LPS export ABC transporter protein LptC